MNKKILSVLIAGALIHINAAAAVIDSASENTKTGTVIVSGSGLNPGENIVIEVFPYDEESGAERTAPDFIGAYSADEAGAYTAEFEMPSLAQTGKKEVFVKPFVMAGESAQLQYYSLEGIKRVIEGWNGAVEKNDTKAMAELINSETNIKILVNSPIAAKLAEELAATDKTELAAELIKSGKVESAEQMTEIFMPLYVNFAVNNLPEETCAEAIAEFYDYIDAEKGDIYNDILSEMTEEERLGIYLAAAGRIDSDISLGELAGMIYEEAVMAGFKSISNYNGINPFMKKYNEDYFQVDFSEYKDLKNTYEVDRQAISKKSSYSSFDQFRRLFEGWVSEQRKSEAKGSSGGGSGSGGRGSSSSSGTPVTGEVYHPHMNVTETVKEEPAFDDLGNYGWAEKYIMLLYGKNIVDGVGGKKFAPAQSVTREQFVKLLSAVAEIPEGTEDQGFEDVLKGEWYERYVNGAKQAGIVNGISDTLFGIGRKITRQDAAVMMLNAVKLCDSSLLEGLDIGSVSFNDEEDISSYAVYAVKALAANGVIEGTENGKFCPQAEAGRAEAAVMIGRILELIGEESK